MPSLFRLLFVLGVLGTGVFGTLYVFAVFLEPKSADVSKSVRNITVKE